MGGSGSSAIADGGSFRAAQERTLDRMSESLNAVVAIATLLALIFFALLLKRRGFLEEAHGKMISRLVTNVTLPALVIVSLSRSRILWNELGLALVMSGAGVACLALGWLIAKLLRLSGCKRRP